MLGFAGQRNPSSPFQKTVAIRSWSLFHSTQGVSLYFRRQHSCVSRMAISKHNIGYKTAQDKTASVPGGTTSLYPLMRDRQNHLEIINCLISFLRFKISLSGYLIRFFPMAKLK